MKLIISTIKEIKAKFPSIRVVNNTNKRGDKFIALIGINHIYSEMQLQADDLFSKLLSGVSSVEDVEASFTSPSDNKEKPGVGLLYIGKSTEVNLDDLSL